jgi:hypothetical protein
MLQYRWHVTLDLGNVEEKKIKEKGGGEGRKKGTEGGREDRKPSLI